MESNNIKIVDTNVIINDKEFPVEVELNNNEKIKLNEQSTIKIENTVDGCILKVDNKEVNLYEGDSFEVINNEGNIEQFIVGGADNSVVSTLFGGVGGNLQKIFGGSIQKWGVAIAASIPFVLLVLFIYFKMDWLNIKYGNLKFINNNILFIIFIFILGISYLLLYGTNIQSIGFLSDEKKNLILNIIKNGSVLLILAISGFMGYENTSKYKSLFITYLIYMIYRVAVNTIEATINDNDTKIYLSTIDNDLILYILTIFMFLSKNY